MQETKTPPEIIVGGEKYNSLGEDYYAGRLGAIIKVKFNEDYKIDTYSVVFKPSIKEG